MSVIILEALQNANHNLSLPILPRLSFEIGKSQLKNAVKLLEKGYSLTDEVEPLLDHYGKVENVPNKEVDNAKP